MEESIVAEETRIHTTRGKVLALLEVVIVRFVLYALIARVLLIGLFGSIEANDPLAGIIVGTLWFVIPFTIILLAKRSFSNYGFKSKNIRFDVDLGLKAFLVLFPTFLGYGLLMGLNWSFIEPNGSLLLTIFFIVSLALMLILLKRTEKDKEFDKRNFYGNLLFILVLLVLPIVAGFLVNNLTFLLVFTVFWQFIFSGFGEEVFFRGYIQSRLNEAFGRPFEVGSIKFGLGLIITALLFSITHMLNTFDIYTLTGEVALWWGTFTFVGGLIFGLLREWSGSILPGGIAHGLDAFGEALGVLFS